MKEESHSLSFSCLHFMCDPSVRVVLSLMPLMHEDLQYSICMQRQSFLSMIVQSIQCRCCTHSITELDSRYTTRFEKLPLDCTELAHHVDNIRFESTTRETGKEESASRLGFKPRNERWRGIGRRRGRGRR